VTTSWVFVLKNPSGVFRVGVCADMARLAALLDATGDVPAGDLETTLRPARQPGPWMIAWREEHPSYNAALARERDIKSKKSATWICTHLLKGGEACETRQPPTASPASSSGTQVHI